jgi:hypothetical protein
MSPDQEHRFFEQLQDIFEKHKRESDEALKNTIAEIKRDLAVAFPDGDMKGHCDYHREIIEQVKARKDFWQKMRYEIYRWGLLGFVLWLLSQFAHAVGIDFWKLLEKVGGLLK